MAAKFIAVFAFVCAFGALNALPTYDTQSFISAAEVVEAVSGVLKQVDDKRKEANQMVDAAIKAALDRAEANTARLAESWNAKVQGWADKATESGVDVADCIVIQKQLPGIVENLRAENRKCVEAEIDGLRPNIKELDTLVPEAQTILDDVKADAIECEKQSSISAFFCLGTALTKQQARAFDLAQKSFTMYSKVAQQIAAAGPNVAQCTAETSASRIAKALGVVESTISCIRGKLSA